MKDFNEIVVFARVAQLGSFSKAASSLEMPVSTVSRKVADLEARLGLTLLQRTTRRLNLTSMGLRYFEQCAELLRGFEEAESRLTEAHAQFEGLLRISTPVGLANSSFMSFIAGVLKENPRLELDLVVTNAFVDLIEENVDVAIRFGELGDSSFIAKRLGSSSLTLVASESYLKTHGIPKEPQDLKNHECIVYKAKTAQSIWVLSKQKSKQRVAVSGRVTASDMAALTRLALSGQGIAQLPEMYTVDEIRKGNLKRVLPDWKSPQSPVNAVYPNRRFNPARLVGFLKLLGEWQSPNWTKS